jgi:hypothetical protein
MPTIRERKRAELKRQECGYQFVASVPHLGHSVEEVSKPVQWTIDRIDARYPSCGSWRVGERNA